MTSQTFTIGPGVLKAAGKNIEWWLYGQPPIDPALVEGGGVAYLRVVRIAAADATIQIMTSVGPSSNIYRALRKGPDLTPAWEVYESAITIEAPGLTPLVISGPATPEYFRRDDREPYNFYILNASMKEAEIATFIAGWVGLSDEDKQAITITLRDAPDPVPVPVPVPVVDTFAVTSVRRSASRGWHVAVRELSPDAVLVIALEINHPDLPDRVRVVSDTQDLVLGGDTFLALRFAFRLADDDNKAPKAELRIDNIGRPLTQWIELAGGGAEATARIIGVMIAADGTAAEEWDTSLDVVGVTVDQQYVTARLGYEPLLGRAAVQARHDAEISPGLF